MRNNTKIKDTLVKTHILVGNNNGNTPGTTTRPSGTTTGQRCPNFENQNAIGDGNIKSVYTITEKGNTKFYGSYDNSSHLASFKPLGFSITLLIFSIYLFHISTKIYRQYFDKTKAESHFTRIFFFCILFFNISWIAIVLKIKELPLDALLFELLNFPNQFVLGIVLSSLLLFGIGIFRFTLIAFIPNSNNNEKLSKDSRFSLIGFIIGILSALANLVTILSFK